MRILVEDRKITVPEARECFKAGSEFSTLKFGTSVQVVSSDPHLLAPFDSAHPSLHDALVASVLDGKASILLSVSEFTIFASIARLSDRNPEQSFDDNEVASEILANAGSNYPYGRKGIYRDLTLLGLINRENVEKHSHFHISELGKIALQNRLVGVVKFGRENRDGALCHDQTGKLAKASRALLGGAA